MHYNSGLIMNVSAPSVVCDCLRVCACWRSALDWNPIRVFPFPCIVPYAAWDRLQNSSHASVFDKMDGGFCSRNLGSLYLHVFFQPRTVFLCSEKSQLSWIRYWILSTSWQAKGERGSTFRRNITPHQGGPWVSPREAGITQQGEAWFGLADAVYFYQWLK